MGLTGQSATVSVGVPFIKAYADIDTGSVTHHIVMFQRVRILRIQMLQLAQIRAITM